MSREVEPADSSGALSDPALALVRDLSEIVADDLGFKPPLADLIAQGLADGMRKRAGVAESQLGYSERVARDAAIRRAFDGGNLVEVCRQFNVGAATVYSACKKR